MRKIWTEAERDFIKRNAGTMRDQDVADKLSQLTGRTVTIQSVRKQRQNMGLKKLPGRGICLVEQKKVHVVETEDAKVSDSGEEGVPANLAP